MGQPFVHSRHPRRAFLRTMLGIAGACALQPFTSAGAVAAAFTPISPTRSATIGVLLPDLPLADLLLQGLQLAVADRPLQIKPYAYGLLPSQALRVARELLNNRQTDLLVGMLSRTGASKLHDQLLEQQIPLFVSDIGANQSLHTQNQAIFRISLNYWQSCAALGLWAATQIGQRALIASSAFEAGFDLTHAFRSGFEQQGGTVITTQLTHKPDGTVDLESLVRVGQAEQPDFIVGLYAGEEAATFSRFYAESPLRNIPLLGPGLLTDEALLARQPAAMAGIITALPWSANLPTIANQQFVQQFHANTGAYPNAIAALGYDTGRQITAMLNATNGDPRLDALRAVANLSVQGTRGQMTIAPATLETHNSIYIRQASVQNGQAGNQIIDEVSTTQWQALVPAIQRTTRYGWSNTYLYR